MTIHFSILLYIFTCMHVLHETYVKTKNKKIKLYHRVSSMRYLYTYKIHINKIKKGMFLPPRDDHSFSHLTVLQMLQEPIAILHRSSLLQNKHSWFSLHILERAGLRPHHPALWPWPCSCEVFLFTYGTTQNWIDLCNIELMAAHSWPPATHTHTHP